MDQFHLSPLEVQVLSLLTDSTFLVAVESIMISTLSSRYAVLAAVAKLEQAGLVDAVDEYPIACIPEAKRFPGNHPCNDYAPYWMGLFLAASSAEEPDYLGINSPVAAAAVMLWVFLVGRDHLDVIAAILEISVDRVHYLLNQADTRHLFDALEFEGVKTMLFLAPYEFPVISAGMKCINQLFVENWGS
jgi:hypothetical protein